MTPDSPEIARLREDMEYQTRHLYGRESDEFMSVRVTDLRHALALIDEARDSCRSCAFVDEIRKQGERLTRMYDLFHEVMAQRPALTPDQCRAMEAAPGVVELRTCDLASCTVCNHCETSGPVDWADR